MQSSPFLYFTDTFHSIVHSLLRQPENWKKLLSSFDKIFVEKINFKICEAISCFQSFGHNDKKETDGEWAGLVPSFLQTALH